MEKLIKLPQPVTKGDVSLEEAIYRRHSTRSFRKEPLEIQEISQILWAAYGKSAYGKKTVPSAGATYPFDIYLVAGIVNKLESGIYLYDGKNHTLIPFNPGDVRKQLARSSYEQSFYS